MSAVAIIPVKPLAGALSRLAPALDPADRRRLQLAMLADVLAACAAQPQLDATLVIADDPDVGSLARAAGARPLADHRPRRGMNAAVAIGQRAAAQDGATSALILTGDLPLLDAAVIGRLLEWAPAAAVTLAPSRDGTGTNALVLRPPGALAPALGPGSLARHRDQARRRGLRVSLAPLAEIALDIDTPDDLATLAAAAPPGSRAGALCRELGIGRWQTAAIFG